VEADRTLKMGDETMEPDERAPYVRTTEDSALTRSRGCGDLLLIVVGGIIILLLLTLLGLS
jgi:hypothetical protein